MTEAVLSEPGRDRGAVARSRRPGTALRRVRTSGGDWPRSLGLDNVFVIAGIYLTLVYVYRVW